MNRSQVISPTLLAILVAIGCGGGTPQDAAATAEDAGTESQRMRLAQAPEGAPPAAAGSASLEGTVQVQGTVPPPQAVRMDADPACQQQHPEPRPSEEVVVNPNGTLKHVFVYVKDGVIGSYPAPTTPAVLDQQGCWYTPHVLGLQVNQPLEIVNSDATLHNVNAKPSNNAPFNLAQPVQGMKSTKKFAKPEVMVRFKCNVHSWMSAYAGVLEHPFFDVTDETGAFTITGLPGGTYTLEAWHETLGTQSQTVTLRDGQSETVQFTFAAK